MRPHRQRIWRYRHRRSYNKARRIRHCDRVTAFACPRRNGNPICRILFRWRPCRVTCRKEGVVIPAEQRCSPHSGSAKRSVGRFVAYVHWGIHTKMPFWDINDLAIRALVDSALDYRGAILRSTGIGSEISHNIFINFRARGNTTRHTNVPLPRSGAVAGDYFGKTNTGESN